MMDETSHNAGVAAITDSSVHIFPVLSVRAVTLACELWSLPSRLDNFGHAAPDTVISLRFWSRLFAVIKFTAPGAHTHMSDALSGVDGKTLANG